MDPGFAALALVVGAFAFFAGSVVKGVTGLGMPLVAISILAIMIDVRTAVPLMVVPAIATNIIQVHGSWRFRSTLRRAAPLLISLAIGTTVGAYFIAEGDPRAQHAILGGVLMIFVASSLLRIEFTVPPEREMPASFAAGLVTGCIGGLTGVFGPILAMYMLAMNLSKNEFVWLMGVMMLVCASTLGLSLSGFGSLGWHDLVLSGAALLPAWLGLRVGTTIRDKVSQATFRRVVLGVVFVMGVVNIAKAAAM